MKAHVVAYDGVLTDPYAAGAAIEIVRSETDIVPYLQALAKEPEASRAFDLGTLSDGNIIAQRNAVGRQGIDIYVIGNGDLLPKGDQPLAPDGHRPAHGRSMRPPEKTELSPELHDDPG